MEIQAFGYLGLGASNLDDWTTFATSTIGMQSVDRANSMRAFRMVLTNRHVLEAIAIQVADGAWTLKWPDATSVNFYGEDSGDQTTKFKLTGVAFAGPDPINESINFSHLDIAILRVDPASDELHEFPKPVTLEIDAAQPEAHRDVFVVGFPGEPMNWSFGGKPPAGFETRQVMSTIFNSKFGVKRLVVTLR
jgi:hypothetical protein